MTRLALLLLLALPLAGCNIVAPAYLLLHGPERIPAAYTLDPNRPTVVLVDVAQGLALRPAVRSAIADQAGQDLLDVGALRTVIDPRSAQSVASLDRLGTYMPVSDIGRAVNAEVVIHVLIESFTLTPDGQTLSPRANLRVKVIDATNEERLFPPPEEDQGQPIALAKPIRASTLPDRGGAWNESELDFARWVGTAIAQYFHEHERHLSHLTGKGAPN